MCRLLFKAGKLALLLILSLPFSGQVPELWGQETDIKTAKKTEEEAVKGSTLIKPHFANGNRAMQDAQAIRQQLLMATNEITVLEQAAILKPAAGTYMELGTDQAQVGRMPEAAAACDKVLSVDPAAKNMQAGCYKNVAIVLTNKGDLARAIAPLQKATQINSQDALAWKLLGDALTNTITSKSEGGKMVYVIPPGTIEAYERYLQLEPNGRYAGEVQAAVEGLTKLTKAPTETKEKN